MILKDLSIKSENKDVQLAIIENKLTNSNNNPNQDNYPKGDLFLCQDFFENIGKKIELQRNSDGKIFIGNLRRIKVDMEPFSKENLNPITYFIEIEGYDEFIISADSISFNSNYNGKYYFQLNGEFTWRILFLKY